MTNTSITYAKINTTTSTELAAPIISDGNGSSITVSVEGRGSQSVISDLTHRISESTTVSDSLTLTVAKALSELVDPAEVFSNNAALGQIILSVVNPTDIKNILAGKTIADVPTNTELLSKAVSTSLIDSATISDTYANSLDKSLSVLASTYEGVSTTANTEDLILREDGSLILRENGDYFIRETADPGALDDNSAATDSLSILVGNTHLDSLSSSEIINLIASKIIVEQALVAESLVASTEKIVSDNTNSTESLTHTVEKILAEIVTNTELATLSPNYALPDTTSNSESIACTFSKLVSEYATNNSITETVSTGSLAQDYILREDGSLLLREDGTSFIIRESLTPTTPPDTLGTAELINFSASKSFIDANIATSEVVVASLSDFLLKEDNSSLILREDGSNFIRES